MIVTIELDYWTAVRLKPLMEMGLNILDAQGRQQFGIDGFTTEDLDKVFDNLNKIKDTPEYAKPLEFESIGFCNGIKSI
jgi:hypothetical protein